MTTQRDTVQGPHQGQPVRTAGEPLDQAKAATETGLSYFADFTIRRYRTNAPSNNQVFLAGRERIYEGMRMAGVPEG